jgi:1-acyl-sn-glycerol-3-phosphate acyltransferase
MATNSGEHWPPHGLVRTPGLIVYEFLEPIPPGLDRREFMQVLEARLEAGSQALLGAK